MNENVNRNANTTPNPNVPAKELPKLIGVISEWKNRHLYGFITPMNGAAEQDIYFHVSSLVGVQPIEIGASVEYVIGEWRGRPCARMVVVIAPAPEISGSNGGAR
jgi:cold shock CspA family protein